MWRYSLRALLLYDIDIASGKDTLKTRPLVPASPPYTRSTVSNNLRELVRPTKRL